MERIAVVTHGRNGYELTVREVPLRVLAVQWLAVHVITPGTFHLLCCRTPAWTSRVGWGRAGAGDPLYEEGELKHSLGTWMYRAFVAMECYGHRLEKVIHRIPLDDATVLAHYPEWRPAEEDELEPGEDAQRVKSRDLKRKGSISL